MDSSLPSRPRGRMSQADSSAGKCRMSAVRKGQRSAQALEKRGEKKTARGLNQPRCHDRGKPRASGWYLRGITEEGGHKTFRGSGLFPCD